MKHNSDFLYQVACAYFHAIEGKPFLPQVRQRGANMIHSVVDAEEAVNLMAKRG